MDPVTGPAADSDMENGEPRKHRSGGASSEGLAGRIAEASRRQELRDPDEGLGLVDRAVNRVAEVIGISALRGLKDTRGPMVIALVGYWIFGLGFAWWLGFGLELGGIGVWYGLAAGLALSGCASVITAFHSAQPPARSQQAWSRSGRAARNARRPGVSKPVHAMTRSQAGSPTAMQPKSITAESRPVSSTRRLPAAMSPCTQSGVRSHRVRSAVPQMRVARSVSMRSRSASMLARVSPS